MMNEEKFKAMSEEIAEAIADSAEVLMLMRVMNSQIPIERWRGARSGLKDVVSFFVEESIEKHLGKEQP